MSKITLKHIFIILLSVFISLPSFAPQLLPTLASYNSTADVKNESLKNKKVPYKEIRQRKHSKNKSNPKAQVVTSDLVLNLDAKNTDGINTPARDATTTTTWTNLSGSTNGTLTSFTLPSSATSGWRGSNARYDPSNLIFDGTDDYVTIPNSSSLNVGNNVTISAWIKMGNLNGRRTIFSTRANNPSGSFALEVGTGNSGSDRIAVTTPGVWNAETNNGVLTANTWYHIAYTRNGTSVGNQMIYVNGVSVPLLTDNPQTFVDNTDVKILGFIFTGSGNPFFGSIGNFRLYRRALSADEVLGNYLAEAPDFGGPLVVTSNLVLDLDASKYDNASPATSATSSMTWTDRSGNSYNGTLTNFTLPTAGSASGWDTVSAGTNLTPSALKFDGTDDYVEKTSFPFITGPFTIAAWVKPTGSTYNWASVVSRGSIDAANSNFAFGIRGSGGTNGSQLFLIFKNAATGYGANIADPVLDDSVWVHIVAVVDSSYNVELFVNGMSIGTDGSNSAPTDGSQALRIGTYSGGNTDANAYFPGSIGNVRIYSTALSASQISQNYLAELPKFNNLSGTPRISLARRSSGTAVGTNDPFYTADYGETLTLNFTSTDLESDTVTLSTPTAPTVGTFTASTVAHPGTATYAYSPSTNDVNMTFKFTVIATDNKGQTSNPLVVTIKGTNYYLPSPAPSQPAALPVSQPVTAPSLVNPTQTTNATPTATPVQNITNTNNGSTTNSQGTTVSAPSINTAPVPSRPLPPDFVPFDLSQPGGRAKPVQSPSQPSSIATPIQGIDISKYKPNVQSDSAKPYIDLSKDGVVTP